MGIAPNFSIWFLASVREEPARFAKACAAVALNPAFSSLGRDNMETRRSADPASMSCRVALASFSWEREWCRMSSVVRESKVVHVGAPKEAEQRMEKRWTVVRRGWGGGGVTGRVEGAVAGGSNRPREANAETSALSRAPDGAMILILVDRKDEIDSTGLLG